ncbi:MAG: DUF493 domain-containing protein [Desulfocapsaceae bacterium]|nr:DUF493 domain-containing protein [Desulfocapsaceae bacterium]
MPIIKSDNTPLEGKPEIHYPCIWQYKVIGREQQRIERAIEEICSPVPVKITYSHSSSSGKYHSYNAEIEVQDDEGRLALYRALHDHPDIQVVL